MDEKSAEQRRIELQQSIEDRNKLRIQHNIDRRAQDKQSISYEAIHDFNRTFQSGVYTIDSLLSSIDPCTPETIDSMLDELGKLRHLLSTSTSFLPNYDLDHSQNKIDELEKRIQEKRKEIGPKKFSFKRATKKTSNKPVVVTETQAPKPPSTSSISIDAERTISQKSNENIVVQEDPLETTLGDFSLSHLSDCTVHILGITTALRLSNLTRCKIYSAPINGSVFIQDCSDLEVQTASRQIRIHETFNSKFHIYTQSRPTIENCNALQFGPYTFTHTNMDKWISQCDFDLSRNEWKNVQDFNWLKPNSPHWSEIPDTPSENVSTQV